MKKFLTFLCCLFSLAFVVGCGVVINPNSGQEYTLKFYSKGETVLEDVNSYVSGTKFELPVMDDSDTENFDGWYANPNFIGKSYTEISAAEYGDKVFYAKWSEKGQIDPNPDNNALQNALMYTNNYKYTYLYTDTNEAEEIAELEFLNGSYKYTYDYAGTNYTDYIIYNEQNDVYTYYGDQGTYYDTIDSTADDFIYYVSHFKFADLTFIDASNYDFVNDVFEAKVEAIQTEAENILYGAQNGEEFRSVKITVVDNKITKVVIVSHCEDDIYGIYDCEYEIDFEGYGTVNFTAPNENVEELPSGYISISDAYETADNTVVSVQGYVTAFVGNNFYVSDGTKGILVYAGSTAYPDVTLGSKVSVTATKTTYKGLVELTTITSVTTLDAPVKTIAPVKLSSVANIDSYMSSLVSIDGLKVVSLPASLDATSKTDISFTVSDGTNEITLFVSKNSDSTLRTNWINFFATLSVGDTIDVTGAVISCYNTNQIAFVSVTTVAKGQGGSDTPVDPSNNTLESALQSINSYKYTYSYTDSDGYEWTSDIEYYNGSFKSTYVSQNATYVDYLILSGNSYYYYQQQADGTYVKCDESSSDFENAYNVFDFVYLDSINSANYTGANGVYVPSAATLQTEAEGILDAYTGETYKTLSIKVTNGVIATIDATSSVSNTEGNYTVTYSVSFSNFGKVSFTAPEATEGGNTGDDYLEISEVIASADNTVVTTIGYVTGTIGNNFYIGDGDDAVYVYAGSKGYDVQIGSLVIVTGTKTTYKGLVEIKTLTKVEVDYTDTFVIEPTELTSISELENYQSVNINFKNLVVSSLPTSFTASTSSDLSFNVSDGTNTATFFISKNIAVSYKDTWYTFLSTLKVGDKFTVENAVVSVYNTYQISLIEQSSVMSGYTEGDPIELTRITANPSSLSVENGTTLEAAMELVTVYKYYNNGTHETAAKTEYSYACTTYEPYTAGTYKVTITLDTVTLTLNVTVKAEGMASFKPQAGSYKLLDETADDFDVTHGMPESGNTKALIIPVSFTDYPAPTSMKSDLEKAFFGTQADTGWESLQSYYAKSSYGKLNITGTVLEPYNTGKKSSYYTDAYKSNENIDYEIIKSALEYYDPTVNFADYDSDNDGYIDALYIIYTAPVDYNGNCDLWWAYTYEYYTDDVETYDNVEADFYFFAGYDFLAETPACNKSLKLNTETFIHETGHILGLDDYYHYSGGEGPDGGAGGGMMMDCNVGDHDPFSKVLLGWTIPTVVCGSTTTIELSSFGASGDCVVVAKDWNGSFFDEYYIIDYYTPDGLNAFEAGNSGLFSTSGIRIFHVDATLNTKANCNGIWYVSAYDNTNTAHKKLSLVQASGSNSIENNNYSSSNSDLFSVGQTYTGSKWYDKTSTGFTVTFNGVTNGKATITIAY